MYNFLVLGLVPGTNLTISFQGWLVLSGLFITGFVIVRYQLRKRPAKQRLMSIQHMRVHASQLHRRAI